MVQLGNKQLCLDTTVYALNSVEVDYITIGGLMIFFSYIKLPTCTHVCKTIFSKQWESFANVEKKLLRSEMICIVNVH